MARRTLSHPNRAHKHKRGGRMVSCSIRGPGRSRKRRRGRDVLGRYK